MQRQFGMDRAHRETKDSVDPVPVAKRAGGPLDRVKTDDDPAPGV